MDILSSDSNKIEYVSLMKIESQVRFVGRCFKQSVPQFNNNEKSDICTILDMKRY